MRSEQGKDVFLPLEKKNIYQEYTDMRSKQGKDVLLPLENIYIYIYQEYIDLR